jgi:uncharacterized membrane protein (UPF0127 family)
MLLLTACMNTKPTSPQPATNVPRIVFPDGHVVQLELATDDATRTQGMMFRDQLPEDRGMLFMFDKSGDYPFWMKNTIIPLDIVWIDEQKRIVHISANTPPCKADPCPSYPPGGLARYVLELGGGVAARHGLANGKPLRFEALDNVVVR